MHFSNTHAGNGSKFAKIAIVSALHLVVGAALVHNMNSKSFSMPKAVTDVFIFTPDAPKPPPPPPAPPEPKQKQKPVSQPKVFRPKPEVDVPQQPQVEPTVQSTSEPKLETDPGPVTPPGPVMPPAPPSTANHGKMFSAALANAGDCAKPDYPARAARNGDVGTVRLALLIGTDGRVTDSKVQSSSGSRELDRAAQSALSLCKFKPAMSGGAAQPAWGQMAYVWTLE